MPRWLVTIGRIFYGAGLAGIGIQHFIFGDFIAVILPSWPAWIPGRSVWAYGIGAPLIAAGIAIVFGIRVRMVAALTGGVLFTLVVLGHIPVQLMGYPGHLGIWTNAFKALTMCGGACVVAATLENRSPVFPTYFERLMGSGVYFLPITAVVFGIDHFVYTDIVAKLVPSWIPGSLFWTCFAGAALIAAGLAMISGVQARLASLLLGVMIFLWLLVLHIPRAIADPRSGNGNEWTSVFEALAFSGTAFMQAVRPVSKQQLKDALQ